jgi:hypothetical protein
MTDTATERLRERETKKEKGTVTEKVNRVMKRRYSKNVLCHLNVSNSY